MVPRDAVMSESILRQSPSRRVQQQRLAHRPDIVNADDLDALIGQDQRHTNRPGGAIGRFVAEEFADEAFAGMTDQQRSAEIVKPADLAAQREVVFVRFTEADARVETDSLVFDAHGR